MSWASLNPLASSAAAVLAAAALVAAPCPAAAVGSGQVAGRLVSGDLPVPGGVVRAFSQAGLEGDPVAVSGPSGEDGRYSLDLPPGRYHLAASKGDLWSYCGQNPVLVRAGERIWIGFNLRPWQPARYAEDPDGGLEGRLEGKVTLNGFPARDVTVSIYLDPEESFRGMAFARSMPTGADGVFSLEMVPESRYYLVARRRISGREFGPMEKGDLFSYYRFNPVRVVGGKTVEVSLPLVEKRQDKEIYGTGLIGMEPGFAGIITGRKGRPIAGIHVFAYLEPEMGHHKPAAISSRSDDRGRYRIFLPRPGTYYVGARGGFGDSPAPGEFFGFYEGTPDHSVTLKEEEFREGMDIMVRKVLVE
jgi:hypothetical protein